MVAVDYASIFVYKKIRVASRGHLSFYLIRNKTRFPHLKARK